MARRPTARDMERVAAARPPKLRRPPAPGGDALGKPARRGLRPSLARPDLPSASDISVETADALASGPGTMHFPFSCAAPAHCRIERRLWTVGRHLCIVNSRSDLMTNLGVSSRK